MENGWNGTRGGGKSLCYVTPTFGRDIERFALLRHSMLLFSPGIPHLALVDTEHCAEFERRFGREPNLRIVPTSDVLPRRLEAERRYWRSWKGDLARRLGRRFHLHTRFMGWKIQQILKLEAIAAAETEAVVFLDSDIVFCRRTDPGHYFDEGRLVMLQSRAETYYDLGYEVARQLLLDGELFVPAEAYNYVHQAPRFYARTGRRLLDILRGRYGDHWPQAFMSRELPSEYTLLGHVARAVEKGEGYCLPETPPGEWVYGVFREEDLEPELAACRAERGRRHFVLVQSNIGMDVAKYGPGLRRILDELAAEEGAAATVS